MFQYFTRKRVISKLYFIFWYGKNTKMVRFNKIKKEIDIISMKKRRWCILQKHKDGNYTKLKIYDKTKKIYIINSFVYLIH